MMRLARAAACVLAVLAAGCERIDAPAQQPQADPQSSRLSRPALRVFSASDPRSSVAHSGTRRIEFTPAPEERLSFRESVATDGAGHFSIQPLGPAGSSVSDWNVFELTQRAREGFLFRYRDFSVRDAELFRRNWSLTPLGETTVAGRRCERYRAERTSDPRVAYELSTDAETGLVLDSREFDADGRQVASMVYETFQLAPDLGAIAWHASANDELPFEPQAGQGTPVLEPRLLPPGFDALEVSTVLDGQDRRWIKRTYSDGIEPLFFLQGLSTSVLPKAHTMKAGSLDSTPDPSSAVVVLHLGVVTVIQGELDGFDLIVVGKASEAELLDLIESALP